MILSSKMRGEGCELLDFALYFLSWNTQPKLHNLSKRLSGPRGAPVTSVVAGQNGIFKQGPGKVLTWCLP